jgi:hypothetical protein
VIPGGAARFPGRCGRRRSSWSRPSRQGRGGNPVGGDGRGTPPRRGAR